MKLEAAVVSLACALALGCGSSESGSSPGTGGSGGAQGGSGGAQGGSAGAQGGSAGATGGSAGATGGSGGSAGSGGGAAGSGGGSGAPSAAELLALVASCNQVSSGKYSTDSGGSATVPICGLSGAVFWQADMDVDCDGKITTQCNSNTDPWFQAQTAATDSQGDPLDAASLPYVVVPGKSALWDYSASGLHFGSVIAVIYQGQVEYAVFGDIGPSSIIGEASYATANDLGIDPDPQFGGADGGVTYIAFTGSGGVVAPIEDHSAAVQLGESLAATLIANN
jgi:Fungal chitosanase of glycosyl hydrolase group 75